MIEIYLLEQLDAFAACGTLSEAAEKLHMTQPTLTRSMQKLEDYFGFPLFQRSKKKVALNEAGRMLADYAKKILAEEKEMEERVQGVYKRLRALSIGSIAPGPLYQLLPDCTALFPDLTVASTVDTEDVLLRALKNDEYDIILLTHPVNGDSCVSQEYISEHLNLSVSIMHPAAARKSITFAEMNGQNFLMYSRVGIWEDIVKTQMPASRFYKQESLEALDELSQFSELPSFSTDITVARFARQNSRRVDVPFSDECATITYYLICKEENCHKWRSLLKPA